MKKNQEKKQVSKAQQVTNNFQYRMTKESFQSIVATRSGEDKGMNPYDYVKKYINETYNLRGICTEVTTF